jgi:hypothetical protein
VTLRPAISLCAKVRLEIRVTRMKVERFARAVWCELARVNWEQRGKKRCKVWLLLLLFVMVAMVCIVIGGFRFVQDKNVNEIYDQKMR